MSAAVFVRFRSPRFDTLISNHEECRDLKASLRIGIGKFYKVRLHPAVIASFREQDQGTSAAQGPPPPEM